MHVEQNVNPFTPSAVEHFRTRVRTVIEDDLGMSSNFAAAFAEHAASLLLRKKSLALPEIACDLESSEIRARWNAVFWENRSRFIADWVAPHVVGRLLDLLCGDGRVGECLAWYGIDVTLTEREGAYACDRRQHQVPYLPLQELARLSPTPRFDTVLLCTVLHHETDPDTLLSLGVRLGRRRVIIVENCLEAQYPIDYQLLMDIFFNQCLNQIAVGCPMSHRPVSGWLESARYYGGTARELDRKERVPGIPLCHQLIVLDLMRPQ